jgi:hypothetical protein
LLAELSGVMSDGVTLDLWILSIGVDNNPWDLYQPLIPFQLIIYSLTLFFGGFYRVTESGVK